MSKKNVVRLKPDMMASEFRDALKVNGFDLRARTHLVCLAYKDGKRKRVGRLVVNVNQHECDCCGRFIEFTFTRLSNGKVLPDLKGLDY